MKKILITHNDLDGVTPIILFKLAFPQYEQEVHSINYSQIEDTFNNLKVDKETEVYIVDISYKNVLYFNHVKELRRKCKAVYWFDHHEIEEELPDFTYHSGKFIYKFDVTRCGTKIFYEDYLMGKETPNSLVFYNYLVQVVDDWDRHQLKMPESAKLNTLLKVIGRDLFVQKFLRSTAVGFTEKEDYVIEVEKDRQKRYFENLTFYPDKGVDTFSYSNAFNPEAFNLNSSSCTRSFVAIENTFVFADSLIATEIFEYFTEQFPSRDVLTVIDLNRKKACLRSVRENVFLIAKKFGGGGHPNAAGFDLPPSLIKEFNKFVLISDGNEGY
jgi:oligoribonuclease NrnB/cAMP/cGMP phosphodiesterase (DHH superfamily)